MHDTHTWLQRPQKKEKEKSLLDYVLLSYCMRPVVVLVHGVSRHGGGERGEKQHPRRPTPNEQSIYRVSLDHTRPGKGGRTKIAMVMSSSHGVQMQQKKRLLLLLPLLLLLEKGAHPPCSTFVIARRRRRRQRNKSGASDIRKRVPLPPFSASAVGRATIATNGRRK